MITLRKKLSYSYMLLALFCILLISIVGNRLMENQFYTYIKHNNDKKIQEIVTLIRQNHSSSSIDWDYQGIEEIGLLALEQGFIIKVTDDLGNVIWDAASSSRLQKIQSDITNAMKARALFPKGRVIEKEYPITFDSKTIGTIHISNYAPFYTTEADIAFLNTLNFTLLGVALFSLIASLLVGTYMAQRISNPILRVVKTAMFLAEGNLKATSTEKTNIKEINELIQAINYLAESLEQQEELRKRLTADVAHELRTPLAAIRSYIEAMLDGVWTFDQERLKSCHEELMRLTRMIKDIEKLSKYEGEITLNKRQFNLHEVAQQIVANFEHEFENKGIELAFHAEYTEIVADQDKLSQVIINLLSNALKYTNEGGSVKLTISKFNHFVEITVTDTGIGISEDDLPHVFERFYRADKSRTRSTGGSGIGLTITRAIVKAHGGKIKIESTVGVGTKVNVILPKVHIY